MGYTTLKVGSKCTIKSGGVDAEVICIEDGKYRLKGFPGTFSASDLKAIAVRPDKIRRTNVIRKTPITAKRSKVNQVSTKQQQLNEFYRALLQYRNAKNSKCAIGLPGCAKHGPQTHHKFKRTGFWLICFKYTIPVCHICHNYITENSDFAIKNGYSISRFEELHYEMPKDEYDFLWNKFHTCGNFSTLLVKIKSLFTIT